MNQLSYIGKLLKRKRSILTLHVTEYGKYYGRREDKLKINQVKNKEMSLRDFRMNHIVLLHVTIIKMFHKNDCLSPKELYMHREAWWWRHGGAAACLQLRSTWRG